MKDHTPGLAGSWTMTIGAEEHPAPAIPLPPAVIAALEQLSGVPAQELKNALRQLETAATPRQASYAHGLCQEHRAAAYVRGDLNQGENRALDTYIGQLIDATLARVG